MNSLMNLDLLKAMGYVGFVVTFVAMYQVVSIVVSFYQEKQKYREIMKDFPGPPPHWLLGNLPILPRDMEGFAVAVELTKKYGPLFTLWFGPKAALMCADPDTVRCILNTSEPKDPVVYSFVKPWIGDGLLISKGRKWARNRRLLTPSFHFEILKPYVGIFNETANTLATKWHCILAGSTESLEMFEHISLMTLDSLLKCIFGYSGPSVQKEEEQNPYITSVYELTALAVSRFRFPPYYSDLIFGLSLSGRRFRKACSVVHTYSHDVIVKRMAERERLAQLGQKSSRKYLDFLDMLLDARDEDGNGLTITEIQHEVDTFMFEGHDTTASAISWCCHNLAKHPQYQEKCRQEVQSFLGDRDEIQWEDMSQFPYLTQCIRESLRITPPVPAVARETTRTLTFPDGRTVPAGAWISIPIYLIHHNELVWENPEVFDPDRFTPENFNTREPFSFIPFSAGPRNCIGQNFAMHELKTAMAVILRNFRLEIDESRPVMGLPEIVLRTEDGMWLKVTPLQ